LDNNEISSVISFFSSRNIDVNFLYCVAKYPTNSDDLNLEQARLLALNGDSAGAAALMAKQMGSAAEFSKMNRIQQEAAAKAVGMSREELATTLTDQEALKGLSGKQTEDAKAALDAARARGMTDAEIRKQGIDNIMNQQSVQERLNNSIEKMKEIFIGASEALLPVFSTLAGIFNLVGYILKPLGALMEWSDKLQSGLGAVVGLLTAAAVAALFLSSASTFGIAIPAILLAAAIGNTVINSQVNDAKNISDGHIGSDGGLVVSGAKGTYKLDPNDSVIAGTNLNKSTSTSTSQPQQDLSPLLEEMRAMRQEQARSNSKPTIVENSVNGTRFGTAVAMNTYKIQ
jgi:hypothetical protein